MVLICRQCGTQIRLWEKFCTHCGAARPDDHQEYQPPETVVKHTTVHHAGPSAPAQPAEPRYGAATAPGPDRAFAAPVSQAKPKPALALETKVTDGCHQCNGTGVVEGVVPAEPDDPGRQSCNCLKGECMYCKGQGVCSYCNGLGATPYGACPQCHGLGKCPFCGGSGRCPTCEGSGFTRMAWITCSRCQGTGKKRPEHWQRYRGVHDETDDDETRRTEDWDAGNEDTEDHDRDDHDDRDGR